MELTKQLILRLSQENHRTLKMLAVAIGKTMTAVVNEWIEEAKKQFVPNIPTREFTAKEIRQVIANDNAFEEQSPELLKWAHEYPKTSKK